MKTRVESDSMGDMKVPENALYGAQTARAFENFPVSGWRFPPVFIRALARIKFAAAHVNHDLNKLDASKKEAICAAASETMANNLDESFVLDIFQTGSGTSTNMNANEVIANRAKQLFPDTKVHPNDHVNMGQSSNDVIPTAIHLSSAEMLDAQLLPALAHLHTILKQKTVEFEDVIKVGRTHLMDATPVTLGQEVSAWARQIELSIERLKSVVPRLHELAIGGTAVGTGLNTHPEFGSRMAKALSKQYQLSFTEAENHFEAQSAQDAIVELSGQLRNLSVSLLKIANDVRLLNAGPRCGLGEVTVPAVQPGSSIMPGKVNPVIAESLAQVCAQVMGQDATIAFAGSSGLLELNVMLPVMAHNILSSQLLLTNATRMFADKCIKDMHANREVAASQIEWSMSMVTPLAPVIGYEKAAKLAKQAVNEKKTVRQLCIEQAVLSEEELSILLDPKRMLHPQ
ncbi:MAG: class II fumarate hydratase [Mariprofundaceae bacterium]|nr:class II fumarate hydratase [Mariprofundaceae bacterium]